MNSSLIQQIQEQSKKTAACKRHYFGTWKGTPVFERLRCVNCGCEWRIGEIGTYIRGYEAAGGDGRDILSDWNNSV